MRAVAIERLLKDLENAAKDESAPLVLPKDLLEPEDPDELAAGMLDVPEEIVDQAYLQRSTLLADHLLSFLESAVEMHNERIRLSIMAEIDHAAKTDDFSKLADETGTGVRKDVEALLMMLVRVDPEGKRDYLNALADIKSTLVKRSEIMHVPEGGSWIELLPVPETAKCSECSARLAEVPFLIVMGSIVTPSGKVVYGDGFTTGDSDLPPGGSLMRGIPVCLECLNAHLSSEIVLRMARSRVKLGELPEKPTPEGTHEEEGSGELEFAVEEIVQKGVQGP